MVSLITENINLLLATCVTEIFPYFLLACSLLWWCTLVNRVLNSNVVKFINFFFKWLKPFSNLLKEYLPKLKLMVIVFSFSF